MTKENRTGAPWAAGAEPGLPGGAEAAHGGASSRGRTRRKKRGRKRAARRRYRPDEKRATVEALLSPSWKMSARLSDPLCVMFEELPSPPLTRSAVFNVPP